MIFADSIADNLEKIEESATQAAKVGADAALFPECATTRYACDFGALKPTFTFIAALLRAPQAELPAAESTFQAQHLAIVLSPRRA